MTTEPRESRSGVSLENLQETIDASTSAGKALQGNLAQYETPADLCLFLNGLLPSTPRVIFDPQCASGRTLRNGIPYWTKKFGFELDNRHRDIADGIIRVTGNCVSAWEVLDDLFPEIKFECQTSNPPFGLLWPVPGVGNVDSTEYTWMKVLERSSSTGYGWFMASVKTIERLKIHENNRVYLYQKFPPGLFKNVEIEIGVVHWDETPLRPDRKVLQHTSCDLNEYQHGEHYKELEEIRRYYIDTEIDRDGSDGGDIAQAFAKIQEVINEEKGKHPKFNVWLDKNGMLRLYLSVRTQVKRKLEGPEIVRLSNINKCHPLTLTPDRESRKLLSELVGCGLYTIEPAAKKAIEDALIEAGRMARPIMPVTDFETVAYAEEEDHLLCIKDMFNAEGDKMFTAGRKYEIKTAAYSFKEKYTRNKPHWSETTGKMYTIKHECELNGTDRYIQIASDDQAVHRFMDRPQNPAFDHQESELWTIFQKPVVSTIADSYPDVIAKNKLILATCEMLADFTYYPGQIDYLARVGAKSYGIVAGATGTGKSLFTISLIQMKGPKRSLSIAPQGTLRTSDSDEDEDDEDDYKASQWLEELTRFARGVPVFQLFSFEDYNTILNANKGVLPHGIYVTYYEAFFKNGALEKCPDSWDDERYHKEVLKRYGLSTKLEPPKSLGDTQKYWCKTVGEERDGIRCILEPCLASLIGREFDMVCVDEGHIVNNADALVTQMLIRLQPAYRYMFTATPITNVVSNLFAMMGWICVPDWYKGNRLNAAWPFMRHELSKFIDMFMTTERDHTQEKILEEEAKKVKKTYRGKVEKSSPVISSPARLLKIIKPSMAYISKIMCNPHYKEPKFIDVRVPMGKEQTALYSHFLNRGNIEGASALTRARKQSIYLRNICADPGGFEHGGPKVSSNFNPKTMTILELMRDIIKRGEQVVFISARKGLTNTIHICLRDCGAIVSRIDSTVSAEQHSYQAHLFKAHKSQVMLMGTKCASSHSFSECPNEIIGSLEYSPGPLNQATGRIDRVNSKYDRTIYCVLNKHSIEELQYDVVATKDDAATICLQGRRVPREFKPVDASEILADAIIKFSDKDAVEERDCESRWPAIRDSISVSLINK